MNDARVPCRVDGVVTEVAGDEQFVFNPADEMMHALNASAAAVLGAVDGLRSIEAISVELASSGLSEDMVVLGLAELQEHGLIALDDELDAPSRRELLIKLGVGAAAITAIPVIESIIAPTAAAASSAPTPTPIPTPTPNPTPTPVPPAAGFVDFNNATQTAAVVSGSLGARANVQKDFGDIRIRVVLLDFPAETSIDGYEWVAFAHDIFDEVNCRYSVTQVRARAELNGVVQRLDFDGFTTLNSGFSTDTTAVAPWALPDLPTLIVESVTIDVTTCG